MELVTRLPPAAIYGVIGVLAGLENIFPPVPADTAVAAGAFLSRSGTISAWSIFLVTWTVNVASAAAVYLAARVWGRRFFEGRLGRRLLAPEHLTTLERLYARHGVWGIFLSRFIPAVRAVLPPFAGVARLDPLRALVPLGLASALWYGALTLLVATLARRLGDVALLVGSINRWVASGAAVTLIVVIGWLWLRRQAKGQ